MFSNRTKAKYGASLKEKWIRWLAQFKKRGKAELYSRLKARTVELEEANRKLILYSQKLNQSLLEHCHVEESLKLSEERTRLIIETAQDAFVSIDSDGIIIDWNKQAARTFGWTRREIIGSNFFTTLIQPQFRPMHEQHLRRFIATGIKPALEHRIELTVLHKNGHPFPVEMTISPIRMGTSTTFNLFLHDITKRKRIEKALEEANDELERRVEARTKELTHANEELRRMSRIQSDFTAMVTHELRIPLAAIKESIGLIADGVSGPVTDEQKDVLTIAHRNVERLSRLINNVLEFNCLQSGRLSLDFSEVNGSDLVTKIYKFMSPHVAAKNLKFKLETPPYPLWLTCDADKIRQVLINLIGNAVKFTAPGGKIHLRLRETDSHVILEVEDTGIGIRNEDRELIFEMFRQVMLEGMWKTGGAGVGLAICKEIVSRHDGKISVDSQIGRGSRFVVTIPQRPAAVINGTKKSSHIATLAA